MPASFDVGVAATTNGQIAVDAGAATTRSGSRASDYDAGTYTFTADSSTTPPSAKATATPDAGYTLCAWSSKPGLASRGGVLAAAPPSTAESFDITSTTTLAPATFAKYWAVTINAAVGGSVSVTTSDAGVVGAPTTIYVRDGWAISLRKAADPGYRFKTEDTPPNITADCTITVVFEELPETTAPVTTTSTPPSEDHFTHGDDDDFLSQADTSRKHLLLKVPNYEYDHPEDDAGSTTGADFWKVKKNAFAIVGDATDFVKGANANNAAWGTDLLADQFEFIDDTRNRGATGNHGDGYDFAAAAIPPNETAARSAGPYSDHTGGSCDNLTVTTTIPDYVGWRDHTDGHRITTTRGDKIEIIGGNYKIVSLGRGTGDASFEMSGGLIVDGDIAPGDLTSVTWQNCPTDTSTPGFGWKAVEQTVMGNVVERFHGTMREEAFGDEMISVTGSPSENTSGYGLGANENDTSNNGKDQALSVSDALFPAGSKAYPTKWDEYGDPLNHKLQKPDIHESTWAKDIRGYTYAQNITENTHVKVDHRETTKIEGNYAGLTQMNTPLTSYWERWNMFLSLGFFEYFGGAMTQFFVGASTTIGFANRFEIFLGLEEQVNIGGFFELNVGAKVEATIPSSWQFDLTEQKIKLDDLDASLNETITGLKTTQAKLKRDHAELDASTFVFQKQVTAILNKL